MKNPNMEYLALDVDMYPKLIEKYPEQKKFQYMKKKKEKFAGGQKIEVIQEKMNLIHIIWRRWIENQKKY